MTINVNSAEILSRMNTIWEGHKEMSAEEKMARVLLDTMDWLHKTTRESYPVKGSDAAKLSHFRQVFGAWKATCRKMKAAPWVKECPSYDMEAAYPMYFKTFYPDLYVAMYLENVFLGIRFSPKQLDWIDNKVKEFESKMLLGKTRAFLDKH